MNEKIIIDAELIDTTYDVATLDGKVSIITRVDELLAKINKEIEELNLDELTTDVDNKKRITERRVQLRADLNKYEDDIKEISKVINEPLDLLKQQFNEKIKPVYLENIELVKDKLDVITELQLKEKTDYAKTYHANKLKSVDFTTAVSYEDVPWNININSSLISIRRTVDEHFKSIEQALFVIDNHEFKDRLTELWIENKYDLGKAMVELQTEITKAEKLLADRIENERKQKEAAELRAKLQAETIEANKQKEVEPVKEVIPEAPVKESVVMPEEIVPYLFQFELTDTELSDLINYLSDKNIEYTLVE